MSNSTFICEQCGAKPKTERLKQDGSPAMPFRWKKTDTGYICRVCNITPPTRNWAFDCSEPLENLPAVEEQMFLAGRYRNTLVEVELARRQKIEDLINMNFVRHKQLDDAIAECEKAIEDTVGKLKAERAKTRSRITDPEIAEAVKQLRSDDQALKRERKRLRDFIFGKSEDSEDETDGDDKKYKPTDEDKEAKKRVKEGLKEIEAWFKEEDDKAYNANSQLYWGTRMTVRKASDSFHKGAPPKFKPSKLHGKLAVQCQNGLAKEKAFSGDGTLVYFTKAAITRRDGSVKDRSHGGPLMNVRFRIGSTDKGKPIWTTVRIVLHREFPDDARIQWVMLLRERLGARYVYRLVFTLTFESHGRPDAAKSGRVAVNLGWRQKPEGLRIAYWVGDDGQEGEYVIPTWKLTQYVKPEDLRSVRDTMFDGIRATVVAWRNGWAQPQWLYERIQWLRQPGKNPGAQKQLDMERQAMLGLTTNWNAVEFPDWLKERLETLAQWKSQSRLASVMLHWRDNRFQGDETIYNALEAWRRRDRHLLEWEANQRAKLQRWRDDQHRCFVVSLMKRYREVVIPNVNWRKMAEGGTPEDPVVVAGVAKFRNFASLGRLTTFFEERMEKILVPATNLTATCAHCGEYDALEDPLMLLQTCKKCGKTEDQDRRAARNAMTRSRLHDVAVATV